MIPKFRAWDKFYECMITPAGIELENGEVSHIIEQLLGETTKSSITYYELMQSTGLKDKNVIEIFEGDIVKDMNEEIGYITFLKQEMGYVIVYKNRDRRLGHRNGIDDFHLETIGNIYEHPHLLKE